VIIVATKKCRTTNFSPSSLVAVLGTGMDKKTGSGTNIPEKYSQEVITERHSKAVCSEINLQEACTEMHLQNVCIILYCISHLILFRFIE
jgi:hypothetical protein